MDGDLWGWCWWPPHKRPGKEAVCGSEQMHGQLGFQGWKRGWEAVQGGWGLGLKATQDTG